MQFKEYGFGMFGWENDDIAIAGGVRDNGYHPHGQMRCLFTAYDKAKAIRERRPADEVARLVLLVNLGDGDKAAPTVDKLIKIEVPKPMRRNGIGRRVVAAVLEAAAADMEICDIKKQAKGFWVKVGTEGFTNRSGKLYATLAKPPAADPRYDADGSHAECLARPDMEERQEAIRQWGAGSAFTDGAGNPTLWLHGTDIDTPFNVFCRWEDFSLGFHFGGPEAANARLRDIQGAGEAGGTIIPVYCRASRPLRLPDLFTWGQDEVVNTLADAGVLLTEEEEEFVYEEASAEAIFAALEEAGYDCVVYGNRCEHKEMETDSLCVWRPELLKSPFAASFGRDDPRLMPQLPTDDRDLSAWKSIANEIDQARERLRQLRFGAPPKP